MRVRMPIGPFHGMSYYYHLHQLSKREFITHLYVYSPEGDILVTVEQIFATCADCNAVLLNWYWAATLGKLERSARRLTSICIEIH